MYVSDRYICTRAFEVASGKTIPFTMGPRRAGDVAQIYAATTKAEEELNWKATRGIKEVRMRVVPPAVDIAFQYLSLPIALDV